MRLSVFYTADDKQYNTNGKKPTVGCVGQLN